MTENYVKGLYFNKKHEKAPSFVLGSLSVKPKEFVEWLREQKPNEKGYVRMQIKEGRDGKQYIALDDWKPTQKNEDSQDINLDELDF